MKYLQKESQTESEGTHSRGTSSIGCQFCSISVYVPCGGGAAAAGNVVMGTGVKVVFGMTTGRFTVGAGGRSCLGGGPDSSSESIKQPPGGPIRTLFLF